MTALAPHEEPPVIIAEEIKVYCDVVFGYLDGHAPIRLLAESGTHGGWPVLEFPKASEVASRLIAVAAQAAARQQGVFVVPATVDVPGSAKAEDISQTGVILIDLDDGDIRAKRDHLVRHIGDPTLEIASGGQTSEGQAKLHLYWRLSEAATGEELQRICHLRGMMAETVGGDRSFRSAHQPIRVPGTIHGKHGHQAPVHLLKRREVEYHLGEIAERIEAMPMLPGMTRAISRTNSAKATQREGSCDAQDQGRCHGRSHSFRSTVKGHRPLAQEHSYGVRVPRRSMGRRLPAQRGHDRAPLG